MLIKVVQNGIESDWFQLTKKAHRELIKMKPEAAIIHIEDVYPESPDAGRVIRLDFRLFTVLTREFKLEDLKQEKRDERHVPMRQSWHQRRWTNSTSVRRSRICWSPRLHLQG